LSAAVKPIVIWQVVTRNTIPHRPGGVYRVQAKSPFSSSPRYRRLFDRTSGRFRFPPFMLVHFELGLVIWILGDRAIPNRAI
jgi:hypothetical protein